MFEKKSSKEKTEKSALKKRDSKKKPAQPKENDDRARRKVKEIGRPGRRNAGYQVRRGLPEDLFCY